METTYLEIIKQQHQQMEQLLELKATNPTPAPQPEKKPTQPPQESAEAVARRVMGL